jgi:hypothetical protein
MDHRVNWRLMAGLKMPVVARTLCAWLVAAACIRPGFAGPAISLTLQTRAPQTSQVLATDERIDPTKIGVVIVDMWNTNDCMTNAQRAAALVPRMNKVLDAARRLGMQIIWAPTDVASQYVGTPQRERAIALPRYPLPHIVNFSCPFSVPTVRPDNCMCGPESYATCTMAGTRWIPIW